MWILSKKPKTKTKTKTKDILHYIALDSNYIKKLNINVMQQNRGEPKYHPGNILHRKNGYIPFILMINIQNVYIFCS